MERINKHKFLEISIKDKVNYLNYKLNNYVLKNIDDLNSNVDLKKLTQDIEIIKRM